MSAAKKPASPRLALSRAYSPSGGSVSPRGRVAASSSAFPCNSPGSGVSSSRSSPAAASQRPLSATTAAYSRILKQQQHTQQPVPSGSRRWTSSTEQVVSQQTPSPPSPSPLQPRRNTVGEVAVYRFHDDDDDDSSEAQTVSDEEDDIDGIPASFTAEHFHDHHNAEVLRGQPHESLLENDTHEPIDVSESLDLTLGAAGSNSFSFLASSGVVEEEEHLMSSSDHRRPIATVTAEEVVEEPSLVHMHKRQQEERVLQPHTLFPPDESPPETPHVTAALALAAASHQSSPPPHISMNRPFLPTSPSPNGSPDNPLVSGGEDSVLFGSVVGGGGGGPAGEDSVLYGSPIRTRVVGSPTAFSADASRKGLEGGTGLGGGTARGYISATSPLRLRDNISMSGRTPETANGGYFPQGTANGGYFPEPTAVIYSPDRLICCCWAPRSQCVNDNVLNGSVTVVLNFIDLNLCTRGKICLAHRG